MHRVLSVVAAALLSACGGGSAATGVTLASGQNTPLGIAVNFSGVYWTTAAPLGSNAVLEVGLSGGTPVTLAAGQTGAEIAVDSTFVYYDDVSTIMKVPLSGGVPEAVVSAGFLVAVDSTGVYWISGGPTEALMKTPLSGGNAVTLVAELNQPQSFAVGSTGVFWTDIMAGTVMTVSLEGGTPVTLASGGHPDGIAVDSTGVYWTDPINGTVMKVGLFGGAPVTLVSGTVNPSGIVVDSTSVYLTVPGLLNGFGCSGGKVCGGAIVKAPLGGGTPVTLAVGDNPQNLAVDSTNVYWTDASAGTVMKVSK